MINDVLLHAQPTKQFVQVERSRGARGVPRQRRRRVDHRRDDSDRRRLDGAIDRILTYSSAKRRGTTMNTTTKRRTGNGSPHGPACARHVSRADRPRAPGRRRARRIPGRRLRGDARGRRRARLGDRNVDRRDQRGASSRAIPTKTALPSSSEFWSRVEQRAGNDLLGFWSSMTNFGANLTTVSQGVPAFFAPHLPAWFGMHARLGVEGAAYYSTSPLRSDAGRPGRRRASQPLQGAAHRRRRERAQRRDALFRQPRRAARDRSRARLRCVAASLSGGPHRRRPLLGRRHLSPTRRSRRCSTTTRARTR